MTEHFPTNKQSQQARQQRGYTRQERGYTRQQRGYTRQQLGYTRQQLGYTRQSSLFCIALAGLRCAVAGQAIDTACLRARDWIQLREKER